LKKDNAPWHKNKEYSGNYFERNDNKIFTEQLIAVFLLFWQVLLTEG